MSVRSAPALVFALVSPACFVFIGDADRDARPSGPPPLGATAVVARVVGWAPDPDVPEPGPTDACTGAPERPFRSWPLHDAPVMVGTLPDLTPGHDRHTFAPGPGPVRIDASPDGWTPVTVHAAARAGGTTHVTLGAIATTTGVILDVSVGGALVRDCVFALAAPGGALGTAPEPVELTTAWVPPGLPVGPPKVDAAGTPLDLAAMFWASSESDIVAPLELRLSEPGALLGGDPGQAWWFDADAGGWVLQGEAIDEDEYVVVPVTRWGWWAVGVEGDLGCAQTSDAALAGAELTSASGRRPGAWRAEVAADGTGCVAVDPTGGTVTAHGGDTGARLLASGAVAAALPDRECGGACEGLALNTEWAADADADGFHSDTDCDDADRLVSPSAPDAPGDGADANCDGVDGVDLDRDGWADGEDCDDLEPAIHPGAPESCFTAADDDCDARPNAEDPELSDAVAEPGGGNGCTGCSAQAVLDLQPKLYWRLADPIGPVAHDSSGFGNDGEIVGLASEVPGITHIEEQTRLFGGDVVDYVRRFDFDAIAPDAFSAAMWIRPQLERRTLLSYAIEVPETADCTVPKAAANEITISMIRGGLRVTIADHRVDFTELDDGVTIPVGAWTHVAVVWTSVGGVEVYTNGALVGRKDLVATDAYGAEIVVQPTLRQGGLLYVGQNQDQYDVDASDAAFDSWQAFQGPIDEVAIFDRAIEPDEVGTLFRAAACGEVLCGGDEDGDGRVDEHLLGSPSCPAGCEDIAASGSWMGEGTYQLDDDVRGVCVEDPPGTFDAQSCGDGVMDPNETCDGAVLGECATCDAQACACVVDVPMCADLPAEYTRDGPYALLDTDGIGHEVVRCLFPDDGRPGWTLVHSHDSAMVKIFALPEDADVAGEKYDVLAANVGNPYDPTYSILGRFGEYGGARGFELRLDWPLTPGNDLVFEWRQDTDPTLGPADAEPTAFEEIDIPIPSLLLGFRGLVHRADFHVFMSGTTADTDAECEWLEPPPAPECPSECDLDYTVGLFEGGAQGGHPDERYRIGALEAGLDAFAPGRTARAVELWVRPWNP